MMASTPIWWRQAPGFCAIAILFVAAFSFGVSGSLPIDPGAELRHQEISDGLARIPKRLHSNATWIQRREVAIPTGQMNILGDAHHRSLEYQRLGTSPPVLATLFIVHCVDARSMNGHHPPVCYPASGWIPVGDVVEDNLVLASGLDLQLSGYRFERGSQGRALTVINGFLAPGDGPVRFASDAIGTVNTLSKSVLGLSQYQVLFAGQISVEDSLRYTKEILSGLEAGIFELLLKTGSPVGTSPGSIARRR